MLYNEKVLYWCDGGNPRKKFIFVWPVTLKLCIAMMFIDITYFISASPKILRELSKRLTKFSYFLLLRWIKRGNWKHFNSASYSGQGARPDHCNHTITFSHLIYTSRNLDNSITNKIEPWLLHNWCLWLLYVLCQSRFCTEKSAFVEIEQLRWVRRVR